MSKDLSACRLWLAGLGSAALVAVLPPGAAAGPPSTSRLPGREVRPSSVPLPAGPKERVAESASPAAEPPAGQSGQPARNELPGAPQTGEREPLTDAWLTTKVKLALLADEGVSGTRINVDTSSRVVTLEGSVRSEAEKQKALEIARGIRGVAEVRDRLTVSAHEAGAPGAPRSGTEQAAPGPGGAAVSQDDEQLARAVRQAIREKWVGGPLTLDGDTLRGPRNTEIEVSVDNGVVTLEGRVPTAEDLLAAAQAARDVPGVRAVKTNMESGRPS